MCWFLRQQSRRTAQEAAAHFARGRLGNAPRRQKHNSGHGQAVRGGHGALHRGHGRPGVRWTDPLGTDLRHHHHRRIRVVATISGGTGRKGVTDCECGSAAGAQDERRGRDGSRLDIFRRVLPAPHLAGTTQHNARHKLMGARAASRAAQWPHRSARQMRTVKPPAGKHARTHARSNHVCMCTLRRFKSAAGSSALLANNQPADARAFFAPR